MVDFGHLGEVLPLVPQLVITGQTFGQRDGKKKLMTIPLAGGKNGYGNFQSNFHYIVSPEKLSPNIHLIKGLTNFISF